MPNQKDANINNKTFRLYPKWSSTVLSAQNPLQSKNQIKKHFKDFRSIDIPSRYGTVFKVRGSVAKEYISENDGFEQYMKGTRQIPSQGHVAMKVIHKRSSVSWSNFSQVVQREAIIQLFVSESYPTITPYMYFAGIDTKHGIGIIISKWLDIRPLPDMIDTMDRETYDALESIIVRIWSLGICHMDLHLNNICMDMNGTITFVDWGHAAFLPEQVAENMRKLLRQSYTSPIHESIWKKLQSMTSYDIADRLRSQVVYKAFAGKADSNNADWIVLQKLWNKIPKSTIKSKNTTKTNNTPNKVESIQSKVKRPSSSTTSTKTFRVMTFSKSDGKIRWRKFPSSSAWSRGLFTQTTSKKTRKQHATPKITSKQQNQNMSTKQNKQNQRINNNKNQNKKTINKVQSNIQQQQLIISNQSNIQSSPKPELENSNKRNTFSNKRNTNT